ncbi:hypothetical protein ACIQ9R_36495 [Streptomyces sp. NPDC094447]|uniref:hypothetical protein n=1 Tax=Streptomyces sp. NPDC094447 TaxID=3366062 RepID=UPI0037FB18C3
MDYAYAVKALPQEGSEAPEPDAGQPPAPAPQERTDDSRPWAGDPYDEGDETDPTAAMFGFGGQNGEEAWLDKAPDGTLTGWVRDGTGQVWRYADPDAWAIDVDDASMTQTHGPDGATAPPAPGGNEEQAQAPDPSDPAAAPADEANPFAMEVAAADETPAPADGEDPAAELEEDLDDDEEEEDEEDGGAKKPWD